MNKDFYWGNLMNHKLLPAIAVICALATTNSQASEVNGIEYTGSGFMTIALGKTLGGSSANVFGYNCPCSVTDYAQGALYDGRSGWQGGPDSKLGLQGSVSFDNKRLSITSQVISRGAQNGAADLEWLYASYKATDKITLQAGRQRLPMFYYSASQDIGLAFPWTHLPVGVYGWEVVNYNGVSVRYQDQFGDWSAASNIFAGSEHNNNSYYWQLTGNGPQSVTNVSWTNIIGANLTLAKDWFETRLVYIQNNTQEQPISNAWDATTMSYDVAPTMAPVAGQRIYGVAVKTDYQNWQLYGEVVSLVHPGLTYSEFGQNFAVGYRHGKWLPMFTWSRYQEFVVSDGVLPGAPSSVAMDITTVSPSLRYDLTTSSDLKLQYDSRSGNGDPFSGSRLLTLAYDLVF